MQRHGDAGCYISACFTNQTIQTQAEIKRRKKQRGEAMGGRAQERVEMGGSCRVDWLCTRWSSTWETGGVLLMRGEQCSYMDPRLTGCELGGFDGASILLQALEQEHKGEGCRAKATSSRRFGSSLMELVLSIIDCEVRSEKGVQGSGDVFLGYIHSKGRFIPVESASALRECLVSFLHRLGFLGTRELGLGKSFVPLPANEREAPVLRHTKSHSDSVTLHWLPTNGKCRSNGRGATSIKRMQPLEFQQTASGDADIKPGKGSR
ncbi:hypothetical protein TESG_08535 [Trichophyton tonsurans CBS 112818]|uniref:Uncharacterized protein n=1 Tax=Trichophyton tonsurans (strain CBS 112818) TaxID=647933 RepID=F2S3R3_TRIT1|nr:hypothetical protein TESG_08535 [Trichophyton tonsurans CBS 112818]